MKCMSLLHHSDMHMETWMTVKRATKNLQIILQAAAVTANHEFDIKTKSQAKSMKSYQYVGIQSSEIFWYCIVKSTAHATKIVYLLCSTIFYSTKTLIK